MLVVVNDLDVRSSSCGPAEAEAELVVYPNAVLPGAVAFEGLETVARRHAQIGKPRRDFELSQLAPRNSFNRSKPRNTPAADERLRIRIVERDNHGL